MTSTQGRVDAQSTIFTGQRWSGPDCFDMWHDYMNLGKLLMRLRNMPEADRWDSEMPKRCAHPNSSPARNDSTSSFSSLSDNSLNGSPFDYCRFCKQNGETARVYRSHKLKAEDGRVVCPILWSYTCPICQATGDQSHTRKYCPRLQRPEAGGMQSGRPSSW